MPLIASDYERPFPDRVYRERVEQTQAKMAERGLDVLLLTDPTNQHYLSAYESDSWFTFQMLLVFRDKEQPVFTGRNMEIRAAEITTWMDDENVQCYSDDYAPNSLYHPVEWVKELVEEEGCADGTIGVEKSSDYLTVDSFERLQKSFENATFQDVSKMVTRQYLVKTDRELEYMREAARITDLGMEAAEEAIAEGVRENESVADVLHTLLNGTEESGGEMPASTPAYGPYHYRFANGRQFQDGDVFGIEFSGCLHNYYSPLCRTVYVGDPPDDLVALWEELNQDLQLILDTVEPGRTCEEVEEIYRNEATHPKASRSGYAIGLGLTSWGEGTASFTEGDETVLEPGMTFHSNPSIDTLNYPGGIGEEGLRMLHSETYVVTEDGCEVLGDYPRKIITV
ncbi:MULTISPECIES: Xaa-Pro peptidase family protein [Salinibaculum]|uniref:Xaa-Pro peptidase family protein n=1 Tax=Salinibaculum TaxID=2732368 RepID=UPI0030CC6768